MISVFHAVAAYIVCGFTKRQNNEPKDACFYWNIKEHRDAILWFLFLY